MDLDPNTARNAASLLAAARQHRTPRIGPIMVLLDNSPILAAYGMVRSGCCEQSRAIAQRASHSMTRLSEPSRRLSPFQKQQQQQQQQQMLLAIMGGSEDLSGGGAAPDAPFFQDPDTTASVARALEMMYYGDQSGVSWENGDSAGGGSSLGGASGACPGSYSNRQWTAAGRSTMTAAEAHHAAIAAASAEAASCSPSALLNPMLSAPCGSNGLALGRQGRLARESMRTIAARHLPLRSARSLRGSLRGMPSGDSKSSSDGSRNGCVRWADVAGMRAKGEDGATRQLLEGVRKRDNEFGYAAVAVEWDIWLSPKKPWDLARARIVSDGMGGLGGWVFLGKEVCNSSSKTGVSSELSNCILPLLRLHRSHRITAP